MKAFTLTEIIITIVIIAFAIFGILNVSVFYSVQTKGLIELADCQAQLNFAAEDIKLHFMSAASTSETFSPLGEIKTSFKALGENDVYTITPNDISDNVDYTYVVPIAGAAKGCLVRRTGAGSEEILVDARFTPKIEFEYTKNDPPNFMVATITGHTKTRPLGMTSPTNDVVHRVGIRFWFINITI
ncbi:MAG: hypothetical protein HQL21_04895 [Candidatus Omnitrophica bacterium]|nr:hypothetical protein [Candidatus Omnitrophota bacterium]